MKERNRVIWFKKTTMYQNPRALHRIINLVCLLLIAMATYIISNMKRPSPGIRQRYSVDDVETKLLKRVDNILETSSTTTMVSSRSVALRGKAEEWRRRNNLENSHPGFFGGDTKVGAPRREVIDYSRDKSKLDETTFEKLFPANFSRIPPNPNFIFHNKLPKCGSSTMNNILKVLRKKNKFNFQKVESGMMTFYDHHPLAEFIQSKVNPPYFLFKHHYWINFEQFGMTQPTFINVMRDPIEWFTSQYYFQRYGWNRKPGCRVEDCGMSKKEFEMDIDGCVASSHPSCALPWMYIPFFCGATPECIDISTLEEKKKSLEIAKQRIVEDYYFVGILEQFEDTLRSLELLLPDYFDGAMEAWKGDFVQKMRELTRTTYKKKMSKQSEDFFRNGPLKYEVELYEFARKLFNKRLQSLGLEPTTNHDEEAS